MKEFHFEVITDTARMIRSGDWQPGWLSASDETAPTITTEPRRAVGSGWVRVERFRVRAETEEEAEALMSERFGLNGIS